MKKIKAIIAKYWAKIFSDGYLSKYQKISLIVAVIAYLAIVLSIVFWVSANSTSTIKNWYGKIPSVSTIVDTQILSNKDAGKPADNYTSSGKHISIIIADLGMSQAITEKAINELPKEFVLAFSPYSSNLEETMKKSLQKEHENLILMPMESTKYPDKDSGPKLLSSRLSLTENTANMNWVLEKGKQSIGVMNFLGSAFLGDKKHVGTLFDTLKERNILFVENLTTESSQAQESASEKGIKYFKIDKKIKGDIAKEKFMNQLHELEKIAKIKGYAIGVIEPYPLAIDLVRDWSLKLNRKGFILASLSTLWKNVSQHD